MTLDEYKDRAKQDLDNAFEAGKAQGGGGVIDSYYDTFWDNYQQNGLRTDCTAMFARSWSDEIFIPKYDINCSTCPQMFQYSGITSLKGKLQQLGLKFDVSQATTFVQMFQGSQIKDIPILDVTNCTSLSYTFGTNAMVETIEKLILGTKLTNVGNAFNGAENLTHVIFEGVLAITGLDLHWSTKLDAESYNSLMNILSTETIGTSITLPPYEIVKSTYDAVYGDGAWDAKVEEKSNWTIAYN